MSLQQKLCGVFGTTYQDFQQDMKKLQDPWLFPKQSLSLARNVVREIKKDAERQDITTNISILQGSGDMIGIRDGLTNIILEYSGEDMFIPSQSNETYNVISPDSSVSEKNMTKLIQPSSDLYDEDKHKYMMMTVQPEKKTTSLAGTVASLLDGSMYTSIPYMSGSGVSEVPMYKVVEEDLLRSNNKTVNQKVNEERYKDRF